MSTESDPRARFQLFAHAWNAQKARESARRAELAELVKSVPVSDELLKELKGLGLHEPEVMRHHPGHSIDAKVEALQVVLAVFRQSHNDLSAALDQFDSFSQQREMSRRQGRAELEEIEVVVRKEVMAYSMAAASLVAHERRVRSDICIPERASQMSTIFDEGQHKFILALRNLIAHEQFPDVNWQISHGAVRLADFVLNADRLLDANSLGEAEAGFVRSCGKVVHVRAVADDYAARVNRFYEWHGAAVTANAPLALSDFKRCRRETKNVSLRMSYNLVLSIAESSKVNPYDHLDLYLLPEQIEEVRSLAHQSKEQIDLIVRLVDREGVCDDELRLRAYKVFGLAGA